MFNADPRFIMAETYTILKGDLGLLAEFDKAINKVESPEQAIELCLEYQSMVTNA
jgi:hypothetical protein